MRSNSVVPIAVLSQPSQLQVGRHEVTFTPPCIIGVTWVGDVSDDEARTVATWYAPYAALTTSVWVTDLSRLGKMSFAASSALGVGPPPGGPARRLRCGFAGANLRTRIVVQLVQALARYTTEDDLSAHFFETMEQLQAWAHREAASVTS